MNNTLSFGSGNGKVTKFRVEEPGDRPADWRWQQANQICEGTLQIESCHDEVVTKILVPIINKNSGLMSDIVKGVQRAKKLKAAGYGPWIEVCLIGGADFKQTAEKMQESIMAMAFYELVFFDIISRRKDTEKIKELVFRPLLYNTINTNDDLKFTEQLISYKHGFEYIFTKLNNDMGDYLCMCQRGNMLIGKEFKLHKSLSKAGMVDKNNLHSCLDRLFRLIPIVCTGINPDKLPEDEYYKNQINLYRKLAEWLPDKQPQLKENRNESFPML